MSIFSSPASVISFRMLVSRAIVTSIQTRPPTSTTTPTILKYSRFVYKNVPSPILRTQAPNTITTPRKLQTRDAMPSFRTMNSFVLASIFFCSALRRFRRTLYSCSRCHSEVLCLNFCSSIFRSKDALLELDFFDLSTRHMR